MAEILETKAFFEMSKEDSMYAKIKELALDRVRSPDPGSIFDRQTREIRGLPDSELLGIFKANGYDALVGYNQEVCGYIAFQRHGDDLHIFAINVEEKYRGSPVIMQLTKDFLDYARRKNAKRIRLSGGGSEKSKKLVHILAREEEKLHIKVDEESCWIDLL